MLDKLKEKLNKILGRDPSPDELKEFSELSEDQKEPEIIKASGDNAEMTKVLGVVNALAKQVGALTETVSKQSEFTKQISEDFTAKAAKEKNANIDEKIKSAKSKGLIPNDSEEAESDWRSMLESNFDATSKIIDNASLIGTVRTETKNDTKTTQTTGEKNTNSNTNKAINESRAAAADAFSASLGD